MGNMGGNQGDLAGHQGQWGASDGKVDRSTEDDRYLLLSMTVLGEDRAWLVDVPHQGLLLAVDGLTRHASEWILDRDRVPVDCGRFGVSREGQKTNQPQKSASASRKKKTLETPPPKIR